MDRSTANFHKEVKYVAVFLFKMFLRYGCPQEIVSHQGIAFCNLLVHHLEEHTEFVHKTMSAYHPHSSFNWDEVLNGILSAYRTSHHDITSQRARRSQMIRSTCTGNSITSTQTISGLLSCIEAWHARLYVCCK